MRTCKRCGLKSGTRAQECKHCGEDFPASESVRRQKGELRKCGVCGATAGKYKRDCSCGERLAKMYVKTPYVRTPRGQRRACASERLTAGMRGPACVCGLRGPHECTRTAEWKEETLSRLAALRT